VFLAGKNLADHDLFESAAPHRDDLLDLDACKRQLVRELLGRPIKIDVLFQPVVGEFHAAQTVAIPNRGGKRLDFLSLRRIFGLQFSVAPSYKFHWLEYA